MDLKELNNRYEEIIQSNRPEEIKINQLSMLMMYMEGAFSIPNPVDTLWKSNHAQIYGLYEKISDSRLMK
ncbi:hypothetical protein ACI2JA_19960 [Alkalihalobacillus sp. NPDC078783]